MIVPSFIGETGQAITAPLAALWQAISNQLPGLVGAIIVFVIGCFVAVILGHAVRIILEKLRVDEFMRKARLVKTIGHTHVPAIIGEIFKWYVLFIFLTQAVALLNLGVLSDLLADFVAWLPNVIVAVIVVLIGLAAANYVQLKMEEHSKQRGVRAVAGFFKFVIIIMSVIIALNQMAIETSLLNQTFLMLIGALSLGIALALGIGMGLGLRKHSEEIIDNVRKNF